MHFLNIILATIFVANFNYVVGNEEKFYEKLRQQAAVCSKGNTYDVEEGGCSNSCLCVYTGVMKCNDNDCEPNGDSENDEDDTKAMFQKLRFDATTCTEGAQLPVSGCGTCTCMMMGILNCQLKNRCLPQSSSGARSNGVANFIMG